MAASSVTCTNLSGAGAGVGTGASWTAHDHQDECCREAYNGIFMQAMRVRYAEPSSDYALWLIGLPGVEVGVCPAPDVAGWRVLPERPRSTQPFHLSSAALSPRHRKGSAYSESVIGEQHWTEFQHPPYQTLGKSHQPYAKFSLGCCR